MGGNDISLTRSLGVLTLQTKKTLTLTVHRKVEKLTKNWQHFLKLNFSTNNSQRSNRFSAPESLLPKLSNAH